VESKLNTVNMTVWVHKECDIMDEEALIKLQEAWNNSERKDECIVHLDDLEGAFWMGTEVGQLGGYGFQGATLGVDGSCKDGKMGSGCCKFKEEGADKCARVGRKEEGTSLNRPELGVALAVQPAVLSEDILLSCDNEAFLCSFKKWVGQGGKATLALQLHLPQPCDSGRHRHFRRTKRACYASIASSLRCGPRESVTPARMVILTRYTLCVPFTYTGGDEDPSARGKATSSRTRSRTP
jgi:hypothetical protein